MQKHWLKALQKTVEYAKTHSPFYQKKLRHMARPLRDLQAFAELPLTTKEELRRKNTSFFAKPQQEWADCFATSGTTGEAVLFPQTTADLRRTAAAEKVALTFSGVTAKDTVLLQMPLHGQLWGAGLSYYLGYQALGATVLRTGPAHRAYQAKLCEALRPTVLHANPSSALHLAEALSQRTRASFRLLILGLQNIVAPDLTLNNLGKRVQRAYPKARINPVYGITESASPWHACSRGHSYHITPQFAYPEIVSEKTLQPLPPGEVGILVLTPLYLEGLPLVRYLTGDVAHILPKPCSCGHPFCLSPILGRTDEQMKIKGVTLYPQALEETLQRAGVRDYLIEVKTARNGLDLLQIAVVAPKKKIPSLSQTFQELLSIKPRIRPTTLDAVQKRLSSQPKPRRFFDWRVRE